MAAPVEYNPRFALPDVIVRAAATTLRAVIERDGEAARPSSGKITIIKEDGTDLVTEAAVTIASDGAAEYTVAAATVPDTLTFSRRYQIRWLLTMPDGNSHVFPREAWLTRFRLYCPVTVQDLVDEFDAIARYHAEGAVDVQKKIDAAWKDVQRRLLTEGKEPALLVSSEALRPVVLHQAAAKIFSNWAKAEGDLHWVAMKDQRSLHDKAWNNLKLSEDLNEDGKIQADERGRMASTVIQTSGGGGGGTFEVPPPRSWSRGA